MLAHFIVEAKLFIKFKKIAVTITIIKSKIDLMTGFTIFITVIRGPFINLIHRAIP